jgi:hypothetical protein
MRKAYLSRLADSAISKCDIGWRGQHLKVGIIVGIDGCLVAKHWKKILETLKQSLTNNFPKKIDDIIVHVFSIAFYKTSNHNRQNVLRKTLYNVSKSCFDTKHKLYCLFWQYTLDILHVLQLFRA